MGFAPSGPTPSSKIVPDDFVVPDEFVGPEWVRPHHHTPRHDKGANGPFVMSGGEGGIRTHVTA